MAFGPNDVTRFIDERLAEKYANATVNRLTGVLEQAYTLAVKEERLSHKPHIKRLPEDNARQGFCDAATFARVEANLPAGLRDFARFAFSTGWRRGECASLDWQNMQDNDTMIRLRPEQTGEK